MKNINDSIVWDGMSFNTLAMAMSSHQDTTFGAYVDRLARNGEWLDASALHALACSFKADLMVWQPAVEPALLGHSCVAGASPSTVMLHVALVNDLHFWGVRLLADQQNFNEGEFMRRPNVADQRAGPVADSDDDLAPGADHLRAAAEANCIQGLIICARPLIMTSTLLHACLRGCCRRDLQYVALTFSLGLGLLQKRTHELGDDIEVHASSSDGNHEAVPGKY